MVNFEAVDLTKPSLNHLKPFPKSSKELTHFENFPGEFMKTGGFLVALTPRSEFLKANLQPCIHTPPWPHLHASAEQHRTGSKVFAITICVDMHLVWSDTEGFIKPMDGSHTNSLVWLEGARSFTAIPHS